MKFLRLFVALLLALAIPLQGFAAAAAAVCMAIGDRGPALLEADHDDGHAHDFHAEDTGQKSGSPHSGADKSSDKGHCALGVAAAAVASFAALHIPEFPAASVIAAMPASFSGIAPETLDRPPLSL